MNHVQNKMVRRRIQQKRPKTTDGPFGPLIHVSWKLYNLHNIPISIIYSIQQHNMSAIFFMKYKNINIEVKRAMRGDYLLNLILTDFFSV
jgi:hypothetical protein